MERRRIKIAVLGAGNVATHLARALSDSADVVQIFSNKIENATLLASSISGCAATASLDDITVDADMYLVSVKDDVIKDIALKTAGRLCDKLWIHTSGSVPADVFAPFAKNYGVLYPLQTFSKNVYVNVAEIPFFVEGSNVNAEFEIQKLAKSLSTVVNHADSETRKRIHAAAVFACNFSNHLWSIAEDILKAGDIDMSVLLPLLRTTLDKITKVSPAEAQTGPARRGDIGTMKKHMSLLDEDKALMYKMLSKSIMRQYNISDDEQNKL